MCSSDLVVFQSIAAHILAVHDRHMRDKVPSRCAVTHRRGRRCRSIIPDLERYDDFRSFVIVKRCAAPVLDKHSVAGDARSLRCTQGFVSGVGVKTEEIDVLVWKLQIV